MRILSEMSVQMRKDLSTYLANWGLWKVDDIVSHITSDTTGLIMYEQQVINAYRYKEFVCLHFWDRWQGVTLEDKMLKKYNKIKNDLEDRNSKIKGLRERTAELDKKLR